MDGETEVEPPDALTLPTPLLIEAEVALLAVQVNVEDPPAETVAGLAVNVPDGAGPIVTVAVDVVVPAAFVSVSVYVVVVVGDTVTDPPDTGVTDPTPLLIEALVAFELVQVSVAELPDAIVPGLALRLPVGLTVSLPALPLGTELVTEVVISCPRYQRVVSLV